MPFLFCLALFVPPALAVAGLAHKKFCEAAPAVFLGLSLALYMLGIFSLLPWAVWLLYFLWIGCVIYLGVLLWRRVKSKKWALPSVGLVAFVVAAAALWWVCRGARYATWDEFSHWGRAVKAVFGQQVLPALAMGEDQFRDYPPGVAPLQALVLWAGGLGFREDVILYVQGLFSVSLLLYPLRSFGRGSALAAPVAALLLFFAPACVFWGFYQQTMVDGLLGVLFGFVLLVHFLGEDGPFECVLQCLALAMLPLVKSSGLLFALMAFFIVAADRLRTARHTGRQKVSGWLVAEAVPPHLAHQKVWRSLAPLLAGIFTAAASWQLFLWLHQVQRRWSPSGFSLQSFMGLFTGAAPAWQRETAKLYFTSIFTETNYGWPVPFLPYMGFFVVFIGVYLPLRRLLPQGRRQRVDTGFWGLWAAGIVYVLGLLFSYLYAFSEYEAVRLASLSRYLNTYLAAMLVFLAGLLVHGVSMAEKPRQWVAALVGGAVLWAVLGQPVAVLAPFVTAPQYAVSSAANAQAYTDAAEAIARFAQGGTVRVYVIAQDDLGATTLRLGYELFPIVLPEHVSSIGPGYAADDLLSLRLTRGEWARMLREGYDLVYLYKTDQAFIEEFGPLFADPGGIQEGRMYRVAAQNGGIVLTLAEPGEGGGENGAYVGIEE